MKLTCALRAHSKAQQSMATFECPGKEDGNESVEAKKNIAISYSCV